MNLNSIQISLVILGCATGTGAMAQDKTDGLWRGAGGAALSATSGNTTASSLQLNADAAKATTGDKVTLGGVVNYAKNKTGGVDETTANKWGAFGQYDYNLTPKAFAFGKLGFEGDKLIDLSLRTTLAGGLGYKLVATPQATVELFGGLGYSTDKYSVRQTVGGRTDTSFSRASVYLGESGAYQLSPTVSFKQRLDLYPAVSGDKAMLAKFNAGLSVAMSGTLNLTVGLTDTYNSKPAAGTKANDVGLFTGVNVKFGSV